MKDETMKEEICKDCGLPGEICNIAVMAAMLNGGKNYRKLADDYRDKIKSALDQARADERRRCVEEIKENIFRAEFDLELNAEQTISNEAILSEKSVSDPEINKKLELWNQILDAIQSLKEGK